MRNSSGSISWGHALLTKLLLLALLKTAHNSSDVHIVALSSYGHMFAPKEGVKFNELKTVQNTLSSFGRYGQSKLAIILWARQLTKEYSQLAVASVHPGMVRAPLIMNATAVPSIVRCYIYVASIFMTPVEWGAKNQLWASVSKNVNSGEYYNPVGVRGGMASSKLHDHELAKKIWDWTETELKEHAG